MDDSRWELPVRVGNYGNCERILWRDEIMDTSPHAQNLGVPRCMAMAIAWPPSDGVIDKPNVIMLLTDALGTSSLLRRVLVFQRAQCVLNDLQRPNRFSRFIRLRRNEFALCTVGTIISTRDGNPILFE